MTSSPSAPLGLEDDIQAHLIERLMQEGAPTEVVYHYTNQEGLLGILRSRSIWCTDIRFLNDSRELLHAQELASAIIEQRLTQVAQPSPEYVLYNRWRHLLGMLPHYPVYVAAFSEERDLLSQWRAYSGRTGYSLGFSAVEIMKAIRDYTLPGILLKCIYDVNRQRQHLEYAIDCIVRAYKQVTSPNTQSYSHAERHFFGFLVSAAACFKHPGFAEEKEWRIMFRGLAGLVSGLPGVERLHRPGTNTLVPYVPFPLAATGGPLPIREIVVGPGPNQALASEALGQLMEGADLFPGAMVAASLVPFRNW